MKKILGVMILAIHLTGCSSSTVKKINLVSKRKFSSKEETINFVQISDLHAGPTIREHFIKGITENIKELSPDILFLTGDLIDGIPDEKMMNVLKPFRDLEVPFGKYFEKMHLSSILHDSGQLTLKFLLFHFENRLLLSIRI